MLMRKETAVEKFIAPMPISLICFVGFMFFIFVYVKNLTQPDLNMLTLCIIFLGLSQITSLNTV